MNDASNVDAAYATVGHSNEHHPLVESRGVIADLNERRVSMAWAIKARGGLGCDAHPQSAPSGMGRPSNRKDRNPPVLKNDVEVRVVQEVRINFDGRTEASTN